MLGKIIIAATLIAAPTLAAASTFAAFDLDGGRCDFEGAYAYFNFEEGATEVQSGSRYIGDGEYYLQSESDARRGKDGMTRYKTVSAETGETVTWTVHPEGYITSSPHYDARSIKEEGMIDVLKLNPCRQG